MSGYIGTQPVPQSTQTRDSFTATSGQTSFATGGYQSGYIDLYLNGIKLAAADYTATNNSDVVLAVGAATGDILEVVAYTAFNTANVTGAVDFTVTGLFTSRGIDDNADATAITIDSSENVSLTGALDVTGTVTADGLIVDGGGLISNSATGNTLVISGSTAVNTGGNITLEGNTASDASQIKFKNGSTEVMRVAGGKVGIGTSTPSGRLSIEGATATSEQSHITFENTSGAKKFAIGGGKSGATNNGFAVVNVTDNTSPLFIDDSGNVLVGQTTASSNTTGTSLRADGRNFYCADGNYSAHFNRKSSDGPIVHFAKDDTIVGSIRTTSGDITIDGASEHTGLRFEASAITPRHNGAASNSYVNLGSSSVTWENLYLDGGVVFGPASASNVSSQTLDTYEEGSWSPQIIGYGQSSPYTQTYSTSSGNYTKIGDQVTAHFSVTLSSKGNMSGAYAMIFGLPYNHAGSPAGTGSFWGWTSLNSAISYAAVEMGSTATLGWINYIPAAGGSQASYMNTSMISNTTSFRGTLSYRTNQ